MSKSKLNISLIITIGSILLSVGGSFAVIQLKANEVDKVKAKAEATEIKVVKVETKLDDIKEAIKEQREDLKEILRALKK